MIRLLFLLIVLTSAGWQKANANDFPILVSLSPNVIESGDSTTFSWQAFGDFFTITCIFDGFPGLIDQTIGGASGQFTFSSTVSRQLTISCESISGSGSLFSESTYSLTIASEQAPTIQASFNPTTIQLGESSSFSWSSQFADSCEVTGVEEGDSQRASTITGTSGSFLVTSEEAGIQTAIVRCDGPGGTSLATASLTTNAPIIIGISFSPNQVQPGQSSVLSWTSQGASSCLVSGVVNRNALNGSVVFTPPSAGVYQAFLNCDGPDGPASRIATLSAAPPLPTVSAAFSPSVLPAPGFTTLFWSSTNATQCTINGPGLLIIDTPQVQGGATTFINTIGISIATVSCTGSGGTASVTTQVRVNSLTDRNSGKDSIKANHNHGFMRLSESTQDADKLQNTDPLVDETLLRSLGMRSISKRAVSIAMDLNNDHSEDRLIFFERTKSAIILLNDSGEFTRINKSVHNIESLESIISISLDAHGNIDMHVKH